MVKTPFDPMKKFGDKGRLYERGSTSRMAGESSASQPPPPVLGYLGVPQTYSNFGVDPNGGPMIGQVALVLIPPGINPAAAVAPGCHMMMICSAPPIIPYNIFSSGVSTQQPPPPPPNTPQPDEENSANHSSGSSGSTRLNPLAEAFVPFNSNKSDEAI